MDWNAVKKLNFCIPIAVVGVLLSITACGGSREIDMTVNVVAVTNVYASIAKEIAGSKAKVTSIINSSSQDPHAFEASARTRLDLLKADLVIENGGGYDDFVDKLLGSRTGSSVIVLNVVNLSENSNSQHSPDFNEHLWFDLAAIRTLANALQTELSRLDPANAEEFAVNTKSFLGQLDEMQTRVASIQASNHGLSILSTEPVSERLTEAMGFREAMPKEVGRLMEEGYGIPLRAIRKLYAELDEHRVAALVINAQIGGAGEQSLIDRAERNQIPVIEVGELIPDQFSGYLDWMSNTIAQFDRLVQEPGK
ncbi:MAG: zinc ABC transporter substrate-binding protein [Microbacteriaceae bacterium]|nr:zinc ABC transporter substrate-binding protein [Microbacteriaceae bacterium]